MSELPSNVTGLSTVEAQALRRQFGPNQVIDHQQSTLVAQLRSSFFHPLALILYAAAVVSGVVGEAASAVIITVVVLIGGAINFLQSYRSQMAVIRLRASVAPTATVLRDGQWSELPRIELVPGDIIRLSAGDLVPADAELVSARDVHVQQAALTGESLPVEKAAGPCPGPFRPDRPDAVLLGTSIVGGTGLARVVATGRKTCFGELASRLVGRPPETAFDRGLRHFGGFIAQAVLLLILSVLLIGAFRHQKFLETLLFAVALAVGLTPEFLPMIVAVTLSRGAVRMARRRVIVKHLAAVQNLGSIDILCSDKTGTLTLGAMDLVAATDPRGQTSERVLQLAGLNSLFETGIKSPLDAAILRHAPTIGPGFRKRDEVPFDFVRRRLTVVVETPDGLLLICKGAPENVLSASTRFEIDGNELELDDATRTAVHDLINQHSNEGGRVLAVACKRVNKQSEWTAADENELTLIGLLVFRDPPRPDATVSIKALNREGVRVIVLTGDDDRVARHVAQQLGFPDQRVLTGNDVDRVSDAALGAIAEDVAVFARLTPSHKGRILQALKLRGHVVGFLGDGVNDAPSLHSADVGISVMGAADVARDAAAVILTEPGLRVLHEGVLEGRRAFGNVMKYLMMGTSSNFGNMLSMAAATVFLPFLPMLPFQVLLNGLLYDLAQITIPADRVDRSFLHKPRKWDVGFIRRFMLFIGPVSTVFDLLTFAALLYVFRANETVFHTGWFVESLATQCLVLFVIRTGGNPLQSRPAPALVATVLLVVVVGVYLPYSPLAESLGFNPLPVAFLAFVTAVTFVYLILVEWAKRIVLQRAWT